MKKNIILQGVVGSTAYGLAGPNSDEDKLGIFLAPLDSVLGLEGAEAVKESLVTTEPDSSLHELGKYLSLALRCNPTVLELMWLPKYTVETEVGTSLVLHRQYFLSEGYVRNAYGGYAKQQADRLLSRYREGKDGFSSDVKKRTAKHARHCARLLHQGEQLLKTREIVLDVSQHRDVLFAYGDIAAKDPEKFYRIFESMFEQFNNTTSKLPLSPDRDKINAFLVKVRKGEL
jgi:hypothetical protein